MSRVTMPEIEKMTAEQKRVYEDCARTRGDTIRGPFTVWLHTPKIAEFENQLALALDSNGALNKRQHELAILTVIRRWSAQFPWFVHRRAALAAGIEPALIDALEARRVPPLATDNDRLIYDLAKELDDTHTLSQANYDRAVAQLGKEALIELVSLVGFYNSITILTNTFEIGTPDGSRLT